MGQFIICIGSPKSLYSYPSQKILYSDVTMVSVPSLIQSLYEKLLAKERKTMKNRDRRGQILYIILDTQGNNIITHMCFCVQAGVARAQRCRSIITPGCTFLATTCAGSSPSHCCLCMCARSPRESSPIRGFQHTLKIFECLWPLCIYVSLRMNGSL